MDQIDISRWLTGDDDIMDTLVGLASLPEESSQSSQSPQNQPTDTGADILEYLLQTGNSIDHNTNASFQPINAQPTQSHLFPSSTSTAPAPSANQVTDPPTDSPPTPIVITDTLFRDSVSVVQEKDNFVTFLPRSAPAAAAAAATAAKKQAAPKKAKFKEPIFVTESPQSYKKKKIGAATNTSRSAEDLSDDDMLDDDMNTSNNRNGGSKQMTSKERRQLRNKISARNFRVRRKEYITQLEEQVAEHEKTISDLKQENEKLRQANQDIMQQLLVQPITPPSSSSDESSSGSEGHHSPNTLPSAYQFQLNDLYDFNLFDQQAQQAHQQLNEPSNLFYLNHAAMPDWNIAQVLGEKGKSISAQEYQKELSRELMNDYPLLAPALMSIVLRHTLSLEYVTALAKEFSEKVGADMAGQDHAKPKRTEEDQETLRGVDIDDLKSSLNSLRIEDAQEPNEADSKKEKPSELELTQKMLTKHFRFYVLYRARGMSHQEIMDRCRPCLMGDKSRCGEGSKDKSKGKIPTNNSMQTLQTYCRVAGNLLKHPHRMTRVSEVLKKEIEFTHNKHISQVQSRYKRLFGPAQSKPRIAN
ncbi:hypothetical protein [Parasitella parasitica]|uniref:BZIP domain-containing protein n=1 Tax=Parasitella parasitica TaxID=35722 RepID=A0A0B7N8D6_9FUNG|nr:hypothetical protein [Parasitella parasitica]